MERQIINLQLTQLIFAYLFVFILLVIVKKKQIGQEKQIIIASLRMTLQLIIIGFILEYVFNNQNPLFSLAILILMEIFAVHNIYSRTEVELQHDMRKIIAVSMFLGTLLSLAYFIFIVVQLKPWFRADYFIPLAGMLIGNSMTGISLGINHLLTGISDKQQLIENYLMLGVEPEKSIAEITQQAFYNAILPTINSMLGMGIVFLPGMMTGQILAGASPLIAIKYQIAIMLGILGSVTLTVFFLIKYGAKTFFNSEKQLKL
ncbi:ABC transporter permease [Halanaerobium salsuginis]|uniref:Putative ABC transport system permease protein n=1 Tax=Halanaerobium salsuginis TaxID=29563 RepID=A0A1I4KRU6_9FIRM|nr:iron export ABC transporter permease subunit FetB [Halanaerobium salsuginis]SFL81514.1 putative ABC transport system permease protein [Halanaerobium salsuginis]